MYILLPIFFGLLMIGADLLTKYWIVTHMALEQSNTIIPGFLNFTYIHNTGAVFGILPDQRWLLIAITAIILVVCIGLLIKTGFKSKLMAWAICLVVAGGVGNLIDRIQRGYVVDFIDVKFMDFYVFNVADCCVVIGALLILLYFVVDTLKEHHKLKAKAEKP